MTDDQLRTIPARQFPKHPFGSENDARRWLEISQDTELSIAAKACIAARDKYYHSLAIEEQNRRILVATRDAAVSACNAAHIAARAACTPAWKTLTYWTVVVSGAVSFLAWCFPLQQPATRPSTPTVDFKPQHQPASSTLPKPPLPPQSGATPGTLPQGPASPPPQTQPRPVPNQP